MYVYFEKDSDVDALSEDETRFNKSIHAVLRPVHPIIKTSNRKITADNLFYSVELTQCLNEKGLAYAGKL